MRKLPVWSTVLGAYHFVWYGRRPFLTLALPAIAILAILFIMFDAIRATAPDTDEGIGPTAVEPSLNLGVMAVKVVYSLAMPAFWVMFCVAWHRHYLVPGEVATIRTALRWGRRQTRFLLIVIGIGALIVILSLVVGVLFGLIASSIGALLSGIGYIGPMRIGVGDVIVFLGTVYAALRILIMEPAIIISIVFAVILARLALLLPSTAVDHHMSIGQCWMFARGNGWRLFLVIFLVEIPIGLIIATHVFLRLTTSWSGPLFVALNHTMVFIGFAVGVSALSIAYRFLSSGSSAGTTLARPSAQ